MTKKLLFTILLTGGLFISCSSDDSDKSEPVVVVPVVTEPKPITVTSLSADFVIKGENLEITGTNFTNKDFTTKVFINDVEVTAKEVTETKIVLAIGDNTKEGINTVRIQVKNILSTRTDFFVVAKGWTKLSALGGYDIQNSDVFDDNNFIFSFINTYGDIGFSGSARKLTPSAKGFDLLGLGNSMANYGYFRMANEKTGVLTTTSQAYYSGNAFETSKNYEIETLKFSPAINGLQIGYLDSKSSIVSSTIGGQLYTADNGVTVVKTDPPAWSLKGTYYRVGFTAFGKSTSNGKFYELGIMNDYIKYGSNKQQNVILESPTGYNNWTVIDTISKAKVGLSSYKFQNINKVLAVNPTDKTLVESTDMLKTWNVIKTDVTAVFLRTETQWYIQSGDKILVTKNSGATWELELELPAGSVVNDISFSTKKIIVSGKKGLHYLKLE
ncbi:IPT/TIG domain-containing protein [Flavobacterium reichenbachii]|nr:IPT/TIG domain-containing protein [Flavobacterium reichenbachii]